jgi:hypothetical protein
LRVNTFAGFSHHGAIAPIGLALALGACSKSSYLEIQLTLPKAPVDFAQQVEWVELSASDATGFDAGPERIPSSPVAGGLGVANPKVILAVSAPAGSEVRVLINGLDAAGNAIGSAGGSKLLGPGTSTLNLTLSAHCAEPRDCDPAAICSGVVACSGDWPVGFGACLDENVGVPDAGTPCGPSDAGQCDGLGSCLDPYCGDGILQADAGEECDWGTDNSDVLPDHCRTDCELPHCGDGVVDPDGGEKCDLDAGNNGRGLGCNATCTLVGAVTTLVGSGAPGLADGIGSAASFSFPYGLALMGSQLYVADTRNRALRRIDLTTARVQTLAGGSLRDAGSCAEDGTGEAALFCQINALIPFDGGVLATDVASLRWVVSNAAGDAGIVTTLAGWISDGGTPPVGFQGGSFNSAAYATPYGMSQIGDIIYTNAHSADLIVASDLGTRLVSQVASAGAFITLGGMTSLGDNLYTTNTSNPGTVLVLDTSDAGAKVATLAGGLNSPDGLCTDGTTIYVCLAGGRTVEQLDPLTGALSLVAGSGMDESIDGVGVDAGFVDPANCAWDPVGRALYVSDRAGQTIRKIQ